MLRAYLISAALSLIVTAGVGAIRMELGYAPSSWLGASLAFGISLLSLYLLVPPAQRNKYNEAFLAPTTLKKIPFALAILALVAIPVMNMGSPTLPLVKEVYSLVQTVVPTIVFCLLAGRVLLEFFRTQVNLEKNFPFQALMSSVVRTFVAYFWVLWVISWEGDNIYQFAIDDPARTVAAVVALWLVSLVVIYGRYRKPALPGYGRTYMGVAVSPATPTIQDLRYTASHEAGHVLVCAALGKIPETMKAVVNRQPESNGPLGYVSDIENVSCLSEKIFAEWKMLLLLGGQVGEAVHRGGTTLGSGDDHKRWLDLATTYLGNHYQGIYYANPQSTLEQGQNEAKLEQLQSGQRELLHRYFVDNEDLLDELASSLYKMGTMTALDLVPILERAKLPKDFPMPYGGFNDFTVYNVNDRIAGESRQSRAR